MIVRNVSTGLSLIQYSKMLSELVSWIGYQGTSDFLNLLRRSLDGNYPAILYRLSLRVS